MQEFLNRKILCLACDSEIEVRREPLANGAVRFYDVSLRQLLQKPDDRVWLDSLREPEEYFMWSVRCMVHTSAGVEAFQGKTDFPLTSIDLVAGEASLIKVGATEPCKT